jgi:conjugal transfer pilus assembly protein TraL
MQPVPIPRHVDEPVTLLIWRADEFVPFFLTLMIGMLLGHLGLALIAGIFCVKAYRRIRDNHPDGVLTDMLYHYGLIPGRGLSFPNPWIRRFHP